MPPVAIKHVAVVVPVNAIVATLLEVATTEVTLVLAPVLPSMFPPPS
jgi:hypothetical protein